MWVVPMHDAVTYDALSDGTGVDHLRQTPRWMRGKDAAAYFLSIRDRTNLLASRLSDADATVQSMPDASPAKWHLAHTTWFFETLLLEPHLRGYRGFNRSFGLLFNSYYESLGARHPRALRGLLTRPSLDTVLAYRTHVDHAVMLLCSGDLNAETAQLLELGCHHEQQHQELLLTDILHLFANNPLKPAYFEDLPVARAGPTPTSNQYIGFSGGCVGIGHEGPSFCFDCEGPRHRVWLEDYKLANRLVTNREWLEFIADGGYGNPLLWLSEGWATVQQRGWTAPLYWERTLDGWRTMTLAGPRAIDPDAPVTHISLFEADACARWSGMRLPTEFEWENAARSVPVTGNFADSGFLAPQPAGETTAQPCQMFGDVWEWSLSAFAPYPGFHSAEGAVGEYNGKFMSGQFVLRGGSCVSPSGHVRASYRNFFPPDARWQFSGVRLAADS